ncbi:photosystem reaction center subunit H [Cereibacter changlensis JA139]|uniref:Photosystem reaction center subunit H n=2 Tax=Cereibacter changlensis TaxID=402884 RepID=A0A2T4JUC3_9RHOB|nr:PRC-barrel domain-containing protein [Cereibacter changlensis]PTE21363.1 photosystem reaction center subunit H [Cereibacter changlensis JA139]PZX56459.1 PRC-barrel domain protein [Cereibacter changlensis]
MDHSAHTPLSAAELNGETLAGAKIYDTEDNTIGSVSHLHGAGPGAQVVVDIGGFLGIGAKPVALPVAQLNFMRDEAGVVHGLSSSTKDELKALPEHRHG